MSDYLAFIAEEGADVYFNLHKRVFSIRGRESRKVFAHARHVLAHHGARFVVSEAGRQRVFKTGQKNVHAFVRLDAGFEYGDLSEAGLEHEAEAWHWHNYAARTMGEGCLVSYNPRKAGHFYRVATGTPMQETGALIMACPTTAKPKIWAI